MDIYFTHDLCIVYLFVLCIFKDYLCFLIYKDLFILKFCDSEREKMELIFELINSEERIKGKVS